MISQRVIRKGNVMLRLLAIRNEMITRLMEEYAMQANSEGRGQSRISRLCYLFQALLWELAMYLSGYAFRGT